MKLKKIITVFLLLTGVACSNLNNNYEQVKENYRNYEEQLKDFNIDKEWWKNYNNQELNEIVEMALKNNSDLKKAAININKALYQANLVGADLVPSFSGGLSSSASKNIKTGDSSIIKYGSSISVNYELDLWRKLSNTASAKEWEYKATIEDMEAVKLALINNVINTYFNLLYLNDAINIINEKIINYDKITNIVDNKYKNGNVSSLEKLQSEQYLNNLKNTLKTYESEKNSQEQNLRNLLNLKPEENIKIKENNLLSIKKIGVNLNIPISVIANRPDVKAYEYRFTSAFKNVKASVSNLYPSISLAASLSSSGDKVGNTFSIPVALGSININLPFLNWNSVKWNIKIDEASYESAKLDFETSVIKALNEIENYYNLYEQADFSLKNREKDYSYQKEIQEHYKNKYNYGMVELKTWLEVINDERDSELNLLKTKFDLIQAENKVYQALGGKFSEK